IQQDNAALLAAHLARIEKADNELAALRARLRHQSAGDTRDETRSPAALPAPPQVAPLSIPQGTPEASCSPSSTTWLLQRLGQLESQNRSAWREFLSRFFFGLRRAT